ncbi:MAG: primosomal protein N' [Gammaproteobacteria bacterium]|jgi:primosomal protein N' (replication factor Y)
MSKQTILKIAVPTPLRRVFDYLLPNKIDATNLQPGMRVKIPFGTREVVGILLGIADSSKIPADKLKPIKEVLDVEPVFSDTMLNLCKWASGYYHYPIGEVLSAALPKLLRQGKKVELKQNIIAKNSSSEKLILNSAQQFAVDKVLKYQDKFQAFLLYGVTGSGKTEVYLHVLEKILSLGKQALILVPEIALTPQTVRRFTERFNVPVVSLHSSLSDRKRLDAWVLARTGVAKIVIGTRSSVFTQFNNLGIIIIDEEHDLSFKQQKGFRYSARDLAVIRANQQKIPIILGSATPSLETLHNVNIKRYQRLDLPERAGSAIHPRYKIIDLRDQRLLHGMSKKLLATVREHLDNDNQVMIFLNRRGYAPILMCHKCGWIAKCKNCDANMTLHSQPVYLHCHHCDRRQPIFRECPACAGKSLFNVGIGTEQLELVLGKYFFDVEVVRIDRDTTRKKGELNKILNNVRNGKKQILVGTQMIAKGHHFPNVTLVGIINVDNGFFSADFRTTERIGQLLIQVAGRAGRAEKPGEVLIQTHHPENPLLFQLINAGYQGFSQAALQERNDSQMPPYSYFVLIRAQALQEDIMMQFLDVVKETASSFVTDKVMLLGPIPSPMLRRNRYYRGQLLLQALERSDLQQIMNKLTPQIEQLKLANKVRWSVDVDPLEMF